MQRDHRRLIFLHGFLGSPRDWDEVIRYLPSFFCEALSYPFRIPDDREAILIGYSMGGRIALRYPHSKIVISAHPGLKTSEEKAARLNYDSRWLELLTRLPLQTFLEQWYAQPLFDSLRSHPRFNEIILRRKNQDPQKLIQMLQNESLARQTFCSEGVFLHGQYDTKFIQLYDALGIESFEIPHAGHACHLENPQGTAHQITSILTQEF